MKDEDLDLLLAGAARVLPPPGSGAHPPPEALARWRLGDGDEPDGIAAHLAECAECRAQVHARPAPVRPLLRRALPAGGIAAALALAASLLLFTRPPAASLEGAELRWPPGAAQTRSAGEAELPRHAADQRLTFTLRSERPLEPAEMSVALFRGDRAGRWDPVSPSEVRWLSPYTAEIVVGAGVLGAGAPGPQRARVVVVSGGPATPEATGPGALVLERQWLLIEEEVQDVPSE